MEQFPDAMKKKMELESCNMFRIVSKHNQVRSGKCKAIIFQPSFSALKNLAHRMVPAERKHCIGAFY